jgi:outer membrane protein assembly factor BamD (BamD/ComL family)
MPSASSTRLPTARGRLARLLLGGAAALAVHAGGCASHKPAPPGPSTSALVGGAGADQSPAKVSGDLAAGQDLYRKSDWAGAEKLFHKIAEDTKNSPQVAEEARYYEAECLWREGKFPKAADTFHRQVMDFPRGAYSQPAAQKMFEIANYWLDDTRKEMDDWRLKQEGKKSVVIPAVFHMEKSKPLLDEEGRAIQILENVHTSDITGPLADKALFLAGSVKFFRGDYVEADHFFTMLYQMHKDSPLAPKAIDLAITAKSLENGGPLYDGRKVAEARQLIDTGLRAYPELAAQKGEFLQRRLVAINAQEAAKDYETAEFYARIHKPGSAYWCFEIVRRRYPGTHYAELAAARMQVLHKQFEEEQRKAAAGGKGWHLWGSSPPPLPNDGAPTELAQPPASAPPQQLPPPRALPSGMMPR